MLRKSMAPAGVAFLMVGGLLQLTNIIAFSSSWPLLMVAAGAFLIWQGVDRGSVVAGVSDSPWVSDMTLLGLLRRSHRSPELRGGSATAVMGVIELDLRHAALANGTARLDVVAFWGGIEIRVPDSWTVDAHVVPLIGAVQSKPAALPPPPPPPPPDEGGGGFGLLPPLEPRIRLTNSRFHLART